jgi:hypothetical protein
MYFSLVKHGRLIKRTIKFNTGVTELLITAIG